MEHTVLIDTNLYLDDSETIFKLSSDYEKILIPITVLKELDVKKYDKDLSYSARSAIKAILEFSNQYKERIIFDTTIYEEDSPDANILASAKRYKAVLATKDISMSIIAESMDIELMLYDVVLNNIFNPYIHVDNEELIFNGESLFDFKNIYEDNDYTSIINDLECVKNIEIIKDSWFFVIIDNKIIYANNPFEYTLERIDNKNNYRIMAVDGTEIEARDSYQICTFFALHNAPHVLIGGRWGSGKSLLATSYSLMRSKKKTFITRAPIGINSKYDIGFLPGPISDKMLDWLQGFMSSLYFIYSNTRNDCDNNGRTYDYVRDKIFNEKFEIIPINSIQGLSLLENDMLIVDECQLIDISYMSMILSRPSENGRLVLLGDIKQAYDVIKPSESGLLKLLRTLPHKYLAYVELKNSYRSPLLEVADKLQDKTIK